MSGKWRQVGGTGVLPETGMMINYTFTEKKEFIQYVEPAVRGRIIYKNFPGRSGHFYVVNDSIYLSHDDEPSGTPYAARLIFFSSDKFSMVDVNGEMQYERIQ